MGRFRPKVTNERQGKFLNFYEVYEYFLKIFLFFSHIDFFSIIFFFMNFHEVYEYF